MARTRREFLADVGRGMLIASVGPAVAADLGLASAFADEPGDRITFGMLEPLVSLMEDTPVNKLLPALVEKLQSGTDLKTLVAAGALANARKFGGQDYVGYHTFMALSPALEMSRELPEDRRALPVLKVLYRNTNLMQQQGGKLHERLHHVHADALPEGKTGNEVLFEAMTKQDMAQADRAFAGLVGKSREDAYNDLQFMVQDNVDVHRVVLAWRSWSMLDVTGKEQAETLLRQSVHFCVESEQRRVQQKHGEPPIRALLPKLLDQYKLAGKPVGDRKADDAWIEKFSQTIYASNRNQAAEAVAAALAEGMSPESIGEAMSLAANRLVLCDLGRAEATGTKGKLSVHGDSVGVHASDAANAWRNIARVSKPRNVMAGLIVGAFHTAGQAGRQTKEPPHAAHLEEIKIKDADALLRETESAIRAREQIQVCALVQRYGDLGHPARPVFDLLLKFACSEDGALHAEKYYRTASEEFATMRPAFRWRELIALARVTASEYGEPAPGYADACRLLKV